MARPSSRRIARKLGALTIGVVTRPFAFEGKRRAVQAESGIEELRNECDTLIVIPNDRLLQLGDRNVSVMDAFRTADQVLLSGVQGITDLITTPGLINLDFADVKSVMSGAGSALMGIGSARGDNRALLAAEQAIASPLLEASMEGAHGVLLSISGGSDLGLFEINEAASLVSDAAHPDANIIFGAVIDDALGDEVRVTVIAAGFDSGRPSAARTPAPPRCRRGAGRAGRPGRAAAARRPMTPDGHLPATARRPQAASAGARRRRRNGGRPAAAPRRRPGRRRARWWHHRAAAAAHPGPGRRAAVRCPTRTSRKSSTSRSSSRSEDAPSGRMLVGMMSYSTGRSAVGRPRRVVTDRRGGRSASPYDSFNLGDHVGDDPADVAANRGRLAARAGRAPRTGWSGWSRCTAPACSRRRAADGAGGGDRRAGDRDARARARVLVADCVPVLLADPAAGVVAAVHAGREGAAGRRARPRCRRWPSLGARARHVTALLGPAVCGACYEVPEDMQAEVARVRRRPPCAPGRARRAWTCGPGSPSPAAAPASGGRPRPALHRRGPAAVLPPPRRRHRPPGRARLARLTARPRTATRGRIGDVAGLEENLRAVRARIAAAARAAGRDPAEVRAGRDHQDLAGRRRPRRWPRSASPTSARTGTRSCWARPRELPRRRSLALRRPAAAQQGRLRRRLGAVVHSVDRASLAGASTGPGQESGSRSTCCVQVDLGGRGRPRGPRRRGARRTCPRWPTLVAAAARRCGCAGSWRSPRGARTRRPAFDRLAALAARLRADHPGRELSAG